MRAVVCVGTDAPSSRAAIDLARDHGAVAATVGLHPHDAVRLDDDWDELVRLSADPAVVGVGETGLDYHYRHSPRDAQMAAFRRHLALAKAAGRALVVHSRDAWDDTFGILEEEGPAPRTVLHCFTGGPDEAARALELGLWLSFSGIVSFRNAEAVRAAAAVVPPDRTLVETDAPFLAPVPHRGRENEPAYLPDVGTALAAAQARSVDDVAASTVAATIAVFGAAAGP